MVDPVGTALGLAALFTTCLEVWDFVDAGRAHATNFSLLRTKLDNQRLLFVLWGKKMGFGANGLEGFGSYDKRLDDPFIAATVRANLNHIQRLFSDTDNMIKRYGIQIIERRSKGRSRRQGVGTGGSGVRSNTQQPAIFRSSYKDFLKQLERDRDSTSVWKATRWSIKDEKKFDTMVKDLADLVSGLDQITAAFISQAEAEELASKEMEDIDDLESLAEIQATTANATVRSAAAVRQWLLGQRDTDVGDRGPLPGAARRGMQDEIVDTNQPFNEGKNGRLSPSTPVLDQTSRAKKLAAQTGSFFGRDEEVKAESTLSMKGLADALPDTPVQQSTAISSTEDKIEGLVTDATLTVLRDGETRTTPLPFEDVTTKGVGPSIQRLEQSSSVATTSTTYPATDTAAETETKSTVKAQESIWKDLLSKNRVMLEDFTQMKDLLGLLGIRSDVRKEMYSELISLQRETDKWVTWAPIESGHLRTFLGTIKGPPDTPYEGGIFYIQIIVPTDYPYRPPRCTFLTRVYHPNINERGVICERSLREDWSPSLRITTTLMMICSVLEDLRPDDASMPSIAFQIKTDRAAFEERARAHTKRFATGEIFPPWSSRHHFQGSPGRDAC